MADLPTSNTGDLTGQIFGQYEIGEQLGQGGMATVYMAQQTSIGRTVAIKVMPTYFLGDPNFLQRFAREVKVIADLSHPRVLPVFDYGQVENRPYIVMAYMPGGTIGDMIKKGPMPLDTVVRLIEQISEGLDHAHNKGIIHRDFKPSNVLLDAHGNAYLADFGIAKVTESTVQLTGSGIVGTPAYMAPEMAEHGDISPSVDIYALGITLYQMLTGKYPFEGETPIRVMMAHTQDPIPDVRESRPELPPAVAEVVFKAMAKKPGDRYKSAGALAAALRSAVSSTATPSPASAAIADDDDGGTMIAMAAPVLTPTPTPGITPPMPSAPPVQAPPPPGGRVPAAVVNTPTPPPPAPARKGFPTWLVVVGVVAVLGIATCLCLVLSPSVLEGMTPSPTDDPTKANLTVLNESGVEICQVKLALADAQIEGVDQLADDRKIADGGTFRLTGINPGDYDVAAMDCDGYLVNEVEGIELPVGNFTWTVEPSE